MTSASRPPAPKPKGAPKGTPKGSGVQLDPADPADAQIIARQVDVARQSGRDGLDRAGSTRGRADLEAAYDEGAAPAPAPSSKASPGKAGGSSTGSGSKGPGWSTFKPTSPAKLPTRAADAGGFLTGLALYTVAVIYIRYGPEGWKGWLKAKFLNQPMDTGATRATGGKPKTKNGGSAAV